MTTLCRVLEVSRSGFYAWCERAPSKRAIEDSVLAAQIQDVFDEHKARYGSIRIVRELKAEGVTVGRHRARKIMRLTNLRARQPRGWKRTTDSRHGYPIAPNLLKREFTVAAPNRAWASDITYLPTREGWLYLAIVIDLYSRIVAGWSMRHRIDQKLTIDALDSAFMKRAPKPGLIVHSDQGVQYAATEYQIRLRAHGALCSMSRKGDCWDNAVAESFFATLKIELLGDGIFEDRATATRLVFEYIEAYYNRRRRHSTLNYVSPVEYEMIRKTA